MPKAKAEKKRARVSLAELAGLRVRSPVLKTYLETGYRRDGTLTELALREGDHYPIAMIEWSDDDGRGVAHPYTIDEAKAWAAAALVPPPHAAPVAAVVVERPAGYGAEETGKRKAGQLRMFNPAERKQSANPGKVQQLEAPRGVLVELGRMTELETERERFVWSLREAPILANDSAGRLFIMYGGRVVRSSSAEEIKQYKRTHWGRGGRGKVREAGVAVGPFKSRGAATSVTYTTEKGIDRGLVDYVHPFGEGGPKDWAPPVLVEHVCQSSGRHGAGCGPKCAAAGSLGLIGGTYRVTDRGIVG